MARTRSNLSRATARGEGSRRERLIDAAARRLNTKGVRDTTLGDLANDLGLTRAALYYYIEDREDLVFQAYRRSCELLARGLGQAIAAGGSPIEVVQGLVSRLLAPDQPQIAALSELGLLRDDDRATVLALYEGVVARLAGVLQAGVRAGTLRPMDPEIVARTVVSMIHGAALPLNWTGERAIDADEYVATLNDVLAQGWSTDRRRPINPRPIDLDALRPARVAAFDREGLAAAKREQILVTASRLFNRKGIDATSMDEIAAELQATKRTLYQHVGDKQAIVTACHERSYRIFRDIEQQAQGRRADGEALIDTLVANQRAAARAWLCEDISPLRQNVGLDAMSDVDRSAFLTYVETLAGNWTRHFESLLQQGQLRALDRALLLPLMPTAPAWLAMGLIVADTPRQAEIAAEVVDVHRLGLQSI